ncbi:MAG: hypothetical protein FJ149_07765 [Euryarchaeota archaeon]|nr:hypothetical protein [Euryarchaeota archaeon]
MSARNRIVGPRAVLVVLAALVVLTQAPGWSAATGSGDYPYKGQGTWRISRDTMVSGEVVVVNGDIVIEEGARLLLLDATIRLNCTYPGQYKIVIRPGGVLDMAQSTIEPVNRSNGYRLVIERAPSGWLLDPKAAFFIGGMVGLGLGFPLGILATAYSYKRWFSRNLPPPV